jgi:tetratricopeptide (TPR) repeat protein
LGGVVMKKILKVAGFILFLGIAGFSFLVAKSFTSGLENEGLKYSKVNTVNALHHNDYKAALEHIKAGIQVAPNDVTLNFLLADTLYRSGQTSEALIQINNAVKISRTAGEDKVVVGLLLIKAAILEKNEQKVEAIKLVEEASKLSKSLQIRTS